MTVSEMKTELLTVKQVAHLAGVGIKTLHHYDAVGLLKPCAFSQAGYRLYGREQLESLQQILFYRALGFPLKTIHKLMTGRSDRLAMLREQRELIRQKQTGLTRLLATLDNTITAAEGGTDMTNENLFEGFHDEAQWNAAMANHNEHIKTTYGADIPPVINADAMNNLARHAQAFQAFMAQALRDGRSSHDAEVQTKIRDHLAFLTANGHETSPDQFVIQMEFFLHDGFHRDMLENAQIGLSYYLAAAARAFATRN
ncbi:MAG: MerR family transcriptional regulator [Asticcacaulis sp.]